MTVARWSWEKNMYAERGRLGALGSFFALVPFSALSALAARGLASLGICAGRCESVSERARPDARALLIESGAGRGG